jgi:hypothetical protein
MNIYLVERKGEPDYDEHYGFVVVASDAKAARQVVTNELVKPFRPATPESWHSSETKVFRSPSTSTVKKLGSCTAAYSEPQVVLTSFKAG